MKKVLVLFRYCNDETILIENYKKLQEKFGFDILPLYIRNVRMSVPLANNLLSTSITTEVISEYEDETIEKIKKALKASGIEKDLIVEVGIVKDVVEEYLKRVDCILMDSDENLDDILLDVLKYTYKPVFIVKKEICNFEKFAIVSDDGIKINKSVTNFTRIFPNIQEFDLLSFDFKNEKNNLLEYINFKGFKVNIKNFSSESISREKFIINLNNYDLIIMGNLSRSFFFEKITKKMGIDLVKNIKSAIFIG